VGEPGFGDNAGMNSVELLQSLTRLFGPPGEEVAVRNFLADYLSERGISGRTDAKGNFIVHSGSGSPRVVVTAHMDEIAMIVRRVEPDGRLRVGPLGGLPVWKTGEGPVAILADKPLPGVLSFGSIHTESFLSNAVKMRSNPLTWEDAFVLTGLSAEALKANGVRPGTRVVLAESRRDLVRLGPLVSGYVLDDRADLVSLLLLVEECAARYPHVAFVATAAEEVGGEGALYYLHAHRPEVCIALELGPNVPDAPVVLNDQPTVWVNDSYAASSAADVRLLAALGSRLGLEVQFQALSRGGSDASCAASHGLCARPITLGLPMENSHGFEVMHPGAMANLARLTAVLLDEA
jgi:putative aminopeptidase FrvX